MHSDDSARKRQEEPHRWLTPRKGACEVSLPFREIGFIGAKGVDCGPSVTWAMETVSSAARSVHVCDVSKDLTHLFWHFGILAFWHRPRYWCIFSCVFLSGVIHIFTLFTKMWSFTRNDVSFRCSILFLRRATDASCFRPIDWCKDNSIDPTVSLSINRQFREIDEHFTLGSRKPLTAKQSLIGHCSQA